MLNQALWRDYTNRQPPLNPGPTLQHMLARAGNIENVLEVGCNRGDNLLTFDCEATGVEPNHYARSLATDRGLNVVDALAYNLPFPDGSFDLVLACGLLIHIGPRFFQEALSELHRVAGRWVLSVEYYAERETPVAWSGMPDGIWKRDYAKEWAQFPDLHLMDWGEGKGLPFPGTIWLLLEKR